MLVLKATVAIVSSQYSSINYLQRELSTAAKSFRAILQKQLDDIHAAGTYKNERTITSPQNTVINIEGSSAGVINFCANNYLGMAVSRT